MYLTNDRAKNFLSFFLSCLVAEGSVTTGTGRVSTLEKETEGFKESVRTNKKRSWICSSAILMMYQ
jgi:hypothetical protein